MLTLSLDRLKTNSVFIRHLRFDVTPELLFKPRFVTADNRARLHDETKGFMFYIDYMEDIGPTLMLMKTYEMKSKSLGDVPEAPREMLLAAVSREGVRDMSGMYPIDEAVEAWLRERLGLTP
jgi:hypothetical protein